MAGSIALATPLVAGATSASAPVFYLDIGASASVGVQPSAHAPQGQRTNEGYSNDLVALEAARGLNLQLTEIGCPGETTTTMLYGGDHCYQSPSTQLGAAIAFLKSHHHQTGLVTLDLGFNDLLTCIDQMTIDTTCVRGQIASLATHLPSILSALKNAAGPDVLFVGLDHYNPYLARSIFGSQYTTFATTSAGMINDLNATLQSAYTSYSIPTANVAGHFRVRDNGRTHLNGVGTVSDNVARICALTWMCRMSHYGPNFHPNDAGYRAIAAAVDALLPRVW